MGKLVALLALFRAGNSVANPRLWIGGAITVSLLLPVITAGVRVARAYGYDAQLSDTDCAEIAGGVIAVVNCIVHVVANDHVGLPAANRARVDGTAAAAPAAGSDESSAPEGGVPPELQGVGQADAPGTGGIEVRPTDPFVEHGS